MTSYSSSKIYQKSLILLIPIPEMVRDGITMMEILKLLDASKGLISYYLGKLKKLGYVHDKPYGITQSGIDFLAEECKNNSHPKCRRNWIGFGFGFACNCGCHKEGSKQ